MKRINVLIALFVMGVYVNGQESNIEKLDSIKYTSYGERIDSTATIISALVLEKYENMKISDSTKLKFSAVVTDVCKSKGCWMKLSLGNNKEAMVRFKDYGFFMPKDIEGKEVIVNGIAFVEEMSVADQQHYAKDAGKTDEEIAEITSTKRTYGFTADGVLLKK